MLGLKLVSRQIRVEPRESQIRLALSFGAGLVATVLSFVSPAIIRRLIDETIPSGDLVSSRTTVPNSFCRADHLQTREFRRTMIKARASNCMLLSIQSRAFYSVIGATIRLLDELIKATF